MYIELNGKELPLNFGFKFIEEIEKLESFKVNVEGQEVSTGMGGLSMLEGKLEAKSPIALKSVIKAATATLDMKPSNSQIEDYILTLAEDEDKYIKLFEDIQEELGKNTLAKVMMKQNPQSQAN